MVFHMVWRCQHQKRKKVSDRRNAACMAMLDVKLNKLTKDTKKNDAYLRRDVPLVAAREQVYQRLESSLRRLHALNEDSTTYLKVLQRLGDELDRVPNDNDATGLMLSLKATAAGRRRRGRQIRVQPTSLTRRRPGLTRGLKRMPAACPLSDQPAKRPRKRPHSLQRNVQDNVPSAGLL
ncbi:hypothetical protein ISCGN_007712 [Ixodes scapularis]